MAKLSDELKLKPYFKKGVVEAGCDEAGRGCLAGPVFAAAVILPEDFFHEFLNDSKQLTEKQRYKLLEVIENTAIDYAVANVNNDEIDKINILNASYLAMHKSLNKLSNIPGHIIIDGNRFKPYKNIPYTCVVKGDSKYFSIAAASVLAKTYRDDFMNKLHDEFPQYGWNKNKGYPTKKHREAIQVYNITPYHRKSFNLLDSQLKLNFSYK